MLTESTIRRLTLRHLVRHYLLSSYCYYINDDSPLTDAAYDLLCKRLQTSYDEIHRTLPDMRQHLALVDRDMLEAGTGFYLKEEDYPTIVRHSADDYYAKCKDGTMEYMLEPHLMPAVSTRRISRTVVASAAESKRVQHTAATTVSTPRRISRSPARLPAPETTTPPTLRIRRSR